MHGRADVRQAPVPQRRRERAREKAGITNLNRVYTRDDMVTKDVIFAATGVTDGSILPGIKREPNYLEAETILMRSKTGSVRRMTYRNPR
jgi:fructose-1,6-bisphosphatase II / sedoheptulose-1,7-bisphosphatase